SPFALEFVLGMIVGALVLRRRFTAPVPLFALAVVWLAAACVATAYSGQEYLEAAWWRPFAIGAPAALLIYAALALEARGAVAPAWLRAQGDASYSLYLWHVLVLGAIGVALHAIRLHGSPARITIVAGGYAAAVAASFAAYAWIERPLLRASRRYVPSASSSAGRSISVHTA
ncbi:MAG: acyltransferase family protein, partial [Candidatus Eremiobacteraeota bacterium]|nr:acyltransferase family protein [Candidatus Eremiobacteraeota bacterium]